MSNDQLKNTELTKKDLIDIQRKGRTEWHYDSTVLKEFFGITTITDIKEASEKVNEFEFRIMSYNLFDFFKLNKLDVLSIKNVDVETEEPPQRIRIEIDDNKYAYIYKRAELFLKKDSSKYVLSIENDYEKPGWHKIRISSIDDTGEKLLESILKYSNDNNFYKGKKIDAKFDFINLDYSYDWSDIILQEDIKKNLQKNINNFIESIDIYKANKIQMKRGIILKGPPGTGKTLLGKILCSKTDWSFIWVPPQFVRYSYITDFCAAARKLSPAILFLEDLDLFAEEREGNRDKALLGELMNELDGLQENNQVLVIATTNKSEFLEKAVMNRPGRFDIMIELPHPEKNEIVAMLKLFTAKLKLSSDVNFQDIATNILNKKEKYSGAHIKEVVNLAILYAIDEKSIDEKNIILLTKKHFDKSINLAAEKTMEIGFSQKIDDDSELPGLQSDFRD